MNTEVAWPQDSAGLVLQGTLQVSRAVSSCTIFINFGCILSCSF